MKLTVVCLQLRIMKWGVKCKIDIDCESYVDVDDNCDDNALRFPPG